MKLSIVSPVYNAAKIVPELVKRISEAAVSEGFDYEIVLVDDRSPDDSWQAIVSEAQKNKHVKGVRLSKNFGQHRAITAGLAESSGDLIVVMDCDLQDDPKDIHELLKTHQQGYDVVFTIKKERAHGFLKNIFSLIYFKIFNFFTESQKGSHQIGNYSLITKNVRNAFLQYNETHRHYLLLLRMLGFRQGFVEVKHHKRFEGKTSYNFTKLIRHAVDGIVSQSLKLLYMSIFLGFFFFFVSIIGAAYYLYNFFNHSVVPGYTSLVTFILLSTGLILISTGVLGIYIGKIFDQVRNRPIFTIDEIVNG